MSQKRSLSVAEALEVARRKGLIIAEGRPAGELLGAAAPRAKRAKPALVAAAFEDAVPGWCVRATIPVEAPSLANEREWRVRNRVAQAHRRAVSRAFGPHLAALAPLAARYHAGGRLLVTLTRLGGRKLDKADNLPASVKYCADGICLLLGADDGDDRIEFRHAQEPGGLVGVRVVIERILD